MSKLDNKEEDLDVTVEAAVTVRDVDCYQCGSSLQFRCDVADDNKIEIEVEPCSDCVEEAKKAGREETQ